MSQVCRCREGVTAVCFVKRRMKEKMEEEEEVKGKEKKRETAK